MSENKEYLEKKLAEVEAQMELKRESLKQTSVNNPAHYLLLADLRHFAIKRKSLMQRLAEVERPSSKSAGVDQYRTGLLNIN